MKRNITVEEFLATAEHWQKELIMLRDMLKSTEMEETVKWGIPCYTINGKNIVGIGGFKSYFGVWFHQGALLKDPKKVLINAQEGTTKALRQWRFTSIDEVDQDLLLAYVQEAIENQKQGKEIKADRNKALTIPAELLDALKQDVAAKANFEAMTKGKQREYAEYISEAKREETKLKRLDKILPMILENKGLNDRYR